MKTWKKVVLGIVLTLVIAISAIVIWQWENIKALYLYATNSTEELQQMAEEKAAEKEKTLEKYTGVTVKDLTPEQEKAIISGEMTVDEAVGAIENSATAAPDENTNSNPANQGKPAQQEPKVSKADEIINSYLKKIYTLKAEFLGKLSNLKDEAQARFYKYPMEERTKANKKKVISDMVIECYELENKCDTEIEKLLKSLKRDLEAIGADTKIVSEIRNAYKDEKSVKKAYYIKLVTE